MTRLAVALLAFALFAAPLAVEAQGARKVSRIGVLWPGPSIPPPPRMESLRQGLRESRYVEGQNLAIEVRYSDKGGERLREIAAELVRLDVQAIVAFGDLSSADDRVPWPGGGSHIC